MAGFQRNVTSTMNVGQAQAPVQNVDLAPLANAASFAFGVYKDTQRKKRREEVLSTAEKLYQEYLDEADSSSNPAIGIQQARRSFDKKITAFATNHEELRLMREVFASNSGSVLEHEIHKEITDPIEKAAAEEARIRSTKENQVSRIRANPELMNALIPLVGQDKIFELRDGVASEDTKSEILRAELKLVSLQHQAAVAEQEAQSDNLNTALSGTNTKIKADYELVNASTANLKAILATTPDMLNEDQASVIKAATNNIDSALGTLQSRIEGHYSDLIDSGRFAKDEIALLQDSRDSKIRQLKNDRETIKSLSQTEIQRMPEYFDLMKDRLGIKATDAMGVLSSIKIAMGESAVAPFVNEVINSKGKIGGLISDNVEEALSELMADGKLDRGDVTRLQYQRVISLYGDTDVDELDPDKNSAIISSFYSDFADKVKKGEYTGLSDSAKQKGTSNFIKILKLAEESNDPNERKNATEFLNHTNFKKEYFDKLDEVDKTILGNMITNFNHDKVTDSTISIVKDILVQGDSVRYNADTGKMELVKETAEVTTTEIEDPFGSSLMIETSLTKPKKVKKTIKVDRTNVDNFNKTVDKILEYKQYDDFFKDMGRKEIADFLITFSPAGDELNVSGTLTQFTPEHKEAKDTGVSIETIQKRKKELTDFQTRLDKLQKSTSKLSVVSALKSLNPTQGNAVMDVLEELDGATKEKPVQDKSSSDLIQIMKDNPELTYQEALELQRKVSE